MQCLNDYNQQNPLLDLRSNYFITKANNIKAFLPVYEQR